MKKLLLSLAASITLLASCSMLGERPDTIKVSSISASVGLVADRHDAYVTADAGLDEAVRAGALAESKHLRDTLGSFKPGGKIPVSFIGAEVKAVCARHDAYVVRDTALDPLSSGVYLRSSELLVRLVIQAESATGP